MKKIFLICFTLLAGMMAFTACHSETMEDTSTSKGELNLSSMKADVDMDIETVYVGSRAGAAVDVNNFLVTIYDAQSQQVQQWKKYSEMPEIVSLPVGTYSIDVASAEAPSNGFDVPFYKGTATCEIKLNEVTSVPEITCKLANMLFSVEYDEEFQSKIGGDVVTTISVGENSLDIPYEETRDAYLIAPSGETTALNVTLKGTIDGEEVDFSQRFESVRVGVHNIIKYEFDPVSDGSMGDGTLNVSIGIDSTMDESDETVGINPGEEPEIDDFPILPVVPPVEGAPSIVGSNFNGSPFDIKNDVLEVPLDVDMDSPLPLQVTLKALNGIAHVFVTIDSDTLTEDVLVGVNLAKSFDLAEPGDLKNGLEGLGFPTGDNVIGQTELLFDITNFTPLLGMFGEANHNFIIRLVDQEGVEITETLKIKSVK